MSGDTRFARRALAFVLLAASLGAEAQVSAKIPKIGVRRVGVPTDDEVDPFREALRVLGYSEGQNIVTEYR
jgi:hypothetical protein